MTRRAYVTGAGGCVGRQLLRELLGSHWEVTALLLPAEVGTFALKDDPRVRSVVGDLNALDAATIPEGAVVFHLAAQVHTVPKTAEQRERFFTVNRDGTKALVQAAKQRRAGGIVFLSTIAVYGARLERGLCDEDAAPEPTTPYAQSKLEAEHALTEICGDDLSYVILRPAVIYGPGDRGNFARLIGAVRGGRFCVIDGGASMKNTLYVSNLGKILAYLGGNLDTCNRTVLNVADPAPRSMRDIALAVADAADIKLRLINLPLWLLRPAAWLGDAMGWVARREMPISTRRLRVMTTDSVVDTQRLQKLLGGRVTLLAFAEGLREYLADADGSAVREIY